MRFNSLSISNLRAVKRFEVDNLGDFVVVAGQNGSGKSCVFDAIRLLKSMYGGYSANEYHQWFGEFAINMQDPESLAKLFRLRDRPIEIRANITFAESEIRYMFLNAEPLVYPIAWQQVTGQPIDFWTFSRIAIAAQLRQQQQEVNNLVSQLAEEVRAALKNDKHLISLEIHPGGEIRLSDCKPAEVAFHAYEPAHLGVIEYHSASRSYSRQQVAGITLNPREFDDRRRQKSLYNWQDKYQNVKTELASSYIRGIIAEKAGSPNLGENLNETMIELFSTFFPDKTYRGVHPQPNGGIEFPVILSTGEQHDIDELSSGEKEILYGYLKLKNSTPKHSVILLDEPELHLNPSLLNGFADFYYRHLGKAQDNQLWLVTHSDTLLRQAVGNINYRVYHMISATALDERKNQALEVVADDDIERVTIDLVGDLAAYRPNGKVVILEGDTEDGLDVAIIKRLFPEFSRRVNLIGGGHKRRVGDLYRVLSSSDIHNATKSRFFSIVDKDSGPQLPALEGTSEFSWDVYHVENYLLDASSVRSAVHMLLRKDVFSTDEEVIEKLKDCALKLVDSLVLKRLQEEVSKLFIKSINLKADPKTPKPAAALSPSIISSAARVAKVANRLSPDDLSEREKKHREFLIGALSDGTWIREFPGRDVLNRFSDEVLEGKIRGSLFANSILDKMAELEVKPKGMAAIIDQIASS